MDQHIRMGVREWGAAQQDNFDQWPPAAITLKPGEQVILSLSDYRSIIITADHSGAIEAYIEGPAGDQISEPVTLMQDYPL